MNKWLPSRIACSALYLSKKMLKLPQPWSRDMQNATDLPEKAVRDSARDICMLINLAHQRRIFEPVYKKYSVAKFLRVASIPVRIRKESLAQSQEN